MAGLITQYVAKPILNQELMILINEIVSRWK